MRPSSLAGLVAAVQVSTACLVLDLHPAYDESAIIFDQALVGAWESSEGGGSLVIQAGEWRSYKIAFTDRTGTTTLTGYLTRIGETRFLDVTPAHGLEKGPLLVAAHAIYRVEVVDDRLVASPLDYDWFRKGVDTKTLARLQPAMDEKQNVILTAGPPALRAWIHAHAETADVFGDPMTFVRKKTM